MMKQKFRLLILLIGALAFSRCVVSCGDDDNTIIAVTEFSIQINPRLLNKGSRITIDTTITPANASNKNINWLSSDESIATVDSNGVITALKKGKTVIIGRLQGSEKTATCEVEVGDWSKVTLTTTKNIGETISLQFVAHYGNQEFIWIDLNNNGVKDEGEQNIEFSKFWYDHDFREYPSNKLTIEAKKITIYGEVAYLGCADNQITALDLTQSRSIKYLECNNNQLNKLDISILKDLESLNCSNNEIETLDFSNIKYIEYLDCSKNKLKVLDCSDTFLSVFDCSENQLEKLNFATGLNTIIQAFNAMNNPNLTCIRLDKDFMPSSTWSKDSTAIWNNSDSVCE